MGTRHIIAIKKGGKILHAQYGQWDGYPSGQGASIRDFFEKHAEDLLVFDSHVDGISHLSQEEIKDMPQLVNWNEVYPWLSRDCGSDILEYILKNETLKLSPAWDCLRKNISIEWSYLIDLDSKECSVFRGSILTGKESTPVTKKDRSDPTQIVRSLYTFPLSSPPTAQEWQEKFKRY